MSDSLQDQLLALGLARKKASATKQKRKPPRKKKPGDSGTGLSLEKAYALRQREEKELADKARRRKQAEDRKRREINQAIRAIVSKNRLNSAEAELSRNFMYKGRIRKVNVTGDQLKALNAGELGLVYLTGGYHLLAPEWVDKVRELAPDHVPDLNSNEGSEEEEEFPVPDDLTW